MPAPALKLFAQREFDKLAAYFGSPEGYAAFGWEGDANGWSPAETAIKAMQAFSQQRKDAPLARHVGNLLQLHAELEKAVRTFLPAWTEILPTKHTVLLLAKLEALRLIREPDERPDKTRARR